MVAELGLKPDEYDRILKLIGCVPSLTELGIFSAMWNEHRPQQFSIMYSTDTPNQGAVGDRGTG